MKVHSVVISQANGSGLFTAQATTDDTMEVDEDVEPSSAGSKRPLEDKSVTEPVKKKINPLEGFKRSKIEKESSKKVEEVVEDDDDVMTEEQKENEMKIFYDFSKAPIVIPDEAKIVPEKEKEPLKEAIVEKPNGEAKKSVDIEQAFQDFVGESSGDDDEEEEDE